MARSDTTRGQSSESHVICAMPAISVAYLWGRGNGDSPVCNNSGDFVNTNLSACYVLVSVQLLHVSRRQKTSKEKQGKKTLVRARKSVQGQGKVEKKARHGKRNPAAEEEAAATALNVSNIFFLLFCMAGGEKFLKRLRHRGKIE